MADFKPSGWLGRAALAGWLLAASLPGTASATTFAKLSTQQFVDASTYIVQGEVLEVWTELDDRGLIWTQARIKVDETFKGPETPDELVVSSLGGSYGDTTLSVAGAAQFTVGTSSLLFLDQVESTGRLVPVSKFLGVRFIRRAPGEVEYYATAFHPQVGFQFDARFLPHPKVEERTMLVDLVTSIHTRLQTGWDGVSVPGISDEKLKKINTPERRLR